jgi:hypothetical protein
MGSSVEREATLIADLCPGTPDFPGSATCVARAALSDLSAQLDAAEAKWKRASPGIDGAPGALSDWEASDDYFIFEASGFELTPESWVLLNRGACRPRSPAGSYG